MKDYYVRFGRRFAVTSTVQIKDEIGRVVLADRPPPATARPAEPDITPRTSIP